MRKLKIMLLGIIIGVLLGLWFGYNLGRDEPLFSNPFADRSLQNKARETTSEVIQDTKRALNKSLD
ncbi:MAG: hypothetical protein LJE74_03450 [Proteobacteria bacterium]|nr:hypothetical protein [Pseudomonadota bacterium]MCG6935489.1 hypothetical protein [Pseudomonadota bacterium]